jgi:hypothetical protein
MLTEADIPDASVPLSQVVYIFPRNVRAILRSRTSGDRLTRLLKKGWTFAGVAFRVAFGVFLFVSIVLAVTAILVVVILALSQVRPPIICGDSR